MRNPLSFSAAVAQGARLLTLPPLPAFPFPNFAGSSVDGAPAQGSAYVTETRAAPVACAYDRKRIEQVRFCLELGFDIVVFVDSARF
jgi:hypothetical protein